MRAKEHTRWSSRAMVAAVLCSSLSACTASTPSQAPYSSREFVTLVVQNNNWLDARIYLLTGSARFRVGTVTGLTRDAVIQLSPSSFSGGGECAIAVELIGSRRKFVSPRVFVEAGGTVDLRIQNSLSFSSISVW